MPPIPIHKNDPIAPMPSNPSAITPQTADPPPTRTTPMSGPATTTSNSDPPAPQPGARPAAPTSNLPGSSSPPAPQPYTATYVTTETRRDGPPPQFTLPPPTDAQIAGRSTTTSTMASKPGPTTLNYGPVSSQYQSEATAGVAPTGASGEERKSLEHPPGYVQRVDNSPYTRPAGGQQGGGEESGTGGTAWGLLSKAGEALKKGEEAAWRAVRNK